MKLGRWEVLDEGSEFDARDRRRDGAGGHKPRRSGPNCG
jgi:hypothetical protein